MTIEQLYELYRQYEKVVTDTRLIKGNSLFFALKGNNFNGNEYALDALDKGAAYAIVDENRHPGNENIIVVNDVLKCLHDLALHHRKQFNIPFIAITGSNGKTTTKELVHAVLSSTHITYTTVGNLNNHIGIPLTILRVKPDAAFAVIEMGANHLNEIEGYCRYALPTHGVITNCGKAHLEGFGGVEGVKKGKGELFDFLRSNNGVAFAYNDYDYLHQMTKGIKEVFWYGTNNGNVTGHAVKGSDLLEVRMQKGIAIEKIQTKLVGNYNLPNVLCAIAIGKYFGLKDEAIRQAIESYTPSNSRSQMVRWKNNNVILDAYNANPSSMKVAIENLVQTGGEKVVMLGGMMELGDESVQEHQQIINLLKKHQWKNVILVGGDFKFVEHAYIYVDNVTGAKAWLGKQKIEGATILIKGSRSIKMEGVIE